MNGTIRDAKSGTRIAGALVTVLANETRTDELGRFEFAALQDADSLITAHAFGYYSATTMVKAGGAINLGLYPLEA